MLRASPGGRRPVYGKAKTLPNLQGLSRFPTAAQTLPSEAVLDALKMMLIGASLNEVLTSITCLIEAHNEGMFVLDFPIRRRRFAPAIWRRPNLPQAFQQHRWSVHRS